MEDKHMAFIRPAKAADVDRIWTIRTQAILNRCAGFYAQDKIVAWADSVMPEGFDHILLTLGAIVYHDKAKVLGFGFIDSEAQSIESVFVDPDYNGRGIGTVIARELQRLSIEKGLKALSLSASLNAVPFYKSLGFSVGGLSAWRHPSGIELSCVTMSKVM
ncbi:GNAT family N-acetyltransferase [Shewanella surugensis]|uniref:GNAT family N-acetyltransferase n=1 Tax=Shewanella surugensis TaxID=212020 RepID=A0ABT0LAL9_9GAMM|nr:GNAT family N-acetyltransferase [Shewanella surugensis]MCL1124748.1 GNAT family N-acetyltransferase [Shewanella surugensis]